MPCHVLDGCRRVLTTEPVHGSTVQLSCCAASAHLFQNLWPKWCQYETPLRRQSDSCLGVGVWLLRFDVAVQG